MTDPTQEFRQTLQAAGLTPPDILVPGKLHRCPSNDKRGDKAGWCKLFEDGMGGIYGDFRQSTSETWQFRKADRMSDVDREAFRQQVEQARRERDAAQAASHREAAKKAVSLWGKAQPLPNDHPYLQRKQITAVSSLREIDAEQAENILEWKPRCGKGVLEGRLIVAPVKIGSNIASVELIDERGWKTAQKESKRVGGWWAAQPLPEGDGNGMALIIGEGISTVLSVRQATGHHVVAALSCGNLMNVAQAMRKRYPASTLLILADIGNGQDEAFAAALSVDGMAVTPHIEGIPRMNTDALNGAKATDFNDLHVLAGLDAVRHQIGNALENFTTEPAGPANDEPEAQEEWPEPMPLVKHYLPEEYPLDSLPDTIRAAVEEVAGFVKAPIPLIASSALAALSLACQAHADIKRAEKLHGPISLYMLAIADSGERKTTCDGFFMSAIRQFEREQTEAMKPAIQQYEAAFAAWDAEREGILSAIRDAGKKGKPTHKMREDLEQLQLSKPESPPVPRLLLEDETPENLVWSLAKQWPSSGIISSEAGMVLGSHAMGRDSVMRNLATLNIVWDGGEFSIGRKTTESFKMRGGRATIALQTQEATLHNFLEKSGDLARGTGFLARFLVSWPASTQGSRMFTEAPMHWPHLSAFHARITAMLSQPFTLDEDGMLTPPIMSLSRGAKDAWIEYHDTIERGLTHGGELGDVRDVASKSADNAARLAALFQMFESGFSPVSQDVFDRASTIAAWHLSESRRFLGGFSLPREMGDATKLDGWIVEHCCKSGSATVGKNYARQHGPIRDSSRLDAAIRELVELDRVRLEKDGKKTMIQVNPRLMR